MTSPMSASLDMISLPSLPVADITGRGCGRAVACRLQVGDTWLQKGARCSSGSLARSRSPTRVGVSRSEVTSSAPSLPRSCSTRTRSSPLDRLIDELWGETPPPTAAKTLQAQVSRLRRSLNGDEDPAAHMLGPHETRGHGYLLKVEPGQVDADRFQGMLEEARRTRAEGKPERGRRGAAPGARPLARPRPGRLRLRAVRTDGDRTPGRAATDGARRAHRRRPRARPPR